eukprot:5250922-Karenia_brevis.AAC.1
MAERKAGNYAPYARELNRAGIDYVPLVWSAYGRPHPRTIAVLRSLARRAARRRGWSDADTLLRRVRTQ